MFKHIKDLINSYKLYKKEKIQDNLNLIRLREQNKLEFERDLQMRKKGNKRLLNNRVLFNKNTGKYEFKITVKHNGIPHTFLHENETEKGCRDVAEMTLIRARFYKATGAYQDV